MLVPALLSLLAAAPTSPVVVVARFVGEGMAEADVLAARTRIEEELQLMGAQPSAPESMVEPGCFDDVACIASAVGDHDAALRVELVRVGPLLQVTAHLFGSDGALLYESDRSLNADGIAATGTLLGTEFAPHIRALTAPDPPTPATLPDAGEPDVVASSPLFVPLLAVGGAVAAVGALALVGGSVLAVERTATAYTPTASGEDKSVALAVAPWATAAAGAGAVLAGVGGALIATAFVLE